MSLLNAATDIHCSLFLHVFYWIVTHEAAIMSDWLGGGVTFVNTNSQHLQMVSV